MWKILNESINRFPTKKCNISELIVDNTTFNEPSDMADKFNSYFSEIPIEIRNSIPLTTVQPESYIEPNNFSTFEMGIFGPELVLEAIKQLESKNCLS